MLHSGGTEKKKPELAFLLDEEDFPIYFENDPIRVAAPRPAAATARPPMPEKKVKRLDTSKVLGKGLKAGTVSISQMLKDGGKKKKVTKDGTAQVDEEEVVDYSNKPRTAFTQDDLVNTWQQYAGKLMREGKSSFASSMTGRLPQLQGDGFTVMMTLDNKIQVSELNNEKAPLLLYLREKLNHWGIQIDYEVTVDPAQKKYYTNKEIFERLTELNPHLIELRRRLNLDPDY